MTEHEELLELRAFKELRVKRAPTVALTFGTLAITTLIAFVYAFFQQTEANRERILAEEKVRGITEQLHDLERRVAAAEEKARIAGEAARVARAEAESQRKKTSVNR